jgi:hypothetical protein
MQLSGDSDEPFVGMVSIDVNYALFSVILCLATASAANSILSNVVTTVLNKLQLLLLNSTKHRVSPFLQCLRVSHHSSYEMA